MYLKSALAGSRNTDNNNHDDDAESHQPDSHFNDSNHEKGKNVTRHTLQGMFGCHPMGLTFGFGSAALLTYSTVVSGFILQLASGLTFLLAGWLASPLVAVGQINNISILTNFEM